VGGGARRWLVGRLRRMEARVPPTDCLPLYTSQRTQAQFYYFRRVCLQNSHCESPGRMWRLAIRAGRPNVLISSFLVMGVCILYRQCNGLLIHIFLLIYLYVNYT
jgi:hypothetical protein